MIDVPSALVCLCYLLSVSCLVCVSIFVLFPPLVSVLSSLRVCGGFVFRLSLPVLSRVRFR